VKARSHLLFIALVIIVILFGEVVTYVPYRSSVTTVVIKSYPSTKALVQAISNGDVDIAQLENLAPQALSQLKNNTNLSIVPIGNFGFTYIGLNLRNPPLNNSIFRKAMLYGFNRERVVSEVLGGYGNALSPGLFSSAYESLGWRNDSIESYPYNPEKASSLLNSIGFVRSVSGVRMDPSTGQLLRTMFVFSKLTDPQAVAAADLFAEDMQAIGIPVISFPETDFDFNSQVRVTYYFDMYIETQSASVAPTWLYNLFAGANDMYPAPLSTNLVGYHDSTFDECAKQLMTASDLGTARAAALKCQGQLALDIPAIPVYSRSLLIVKRKGALGISPITGNVADTIAASLANMTGNGIVRIGEVAGLADINPAVSLGAADSLTLRLITEPLLTHGADGSPQPGLVDHWRMSENDTNLTLVLRQGLAFQDGNPTTAHDLAATLNWLITNMIPSTPLYPVLKTIRNVTEVDDHAITISFDKSNYFAADEIADIFALPGDSLPNGSGPLVLLSSGGLEPSGAFTLVTFVQGIEVELQSASSSRGNRVVTLSGVQAQDIFGAFIGGSQIQIRSPPLSYEGEPITNATFTATIRDDGSERVIGGSYVGFGVYSANLNLNKQMLSAGSHRVTTVLYGQLPTGVVIEFDQQNLVVHPPQLLWQVVIYLLAVAAVGLAVYRSSLVRRKKVAKRRVRRSRKTRAMRPRRKRKSLT
jgi:ABC-type transport system substrate-binding protein